MWRHSGGMGMGRVLEEEGGGYVRVEDYDGMR
jgi:hypothetical protein